jgi:hypothetical protein
MLHRSSSEQESFPTRVLPWRIDTAADPGRDEVDGDDRQLPEPEAGLNDSVLNGGIKGFERNRRATNSIVPHTGNKNVVQNKNRAQAASHGRGLVQAGA